MKWTLALFSLFALVATSGAQSKPQVSFPGPEKMVVVHGGTTVEFLSNGSVKIRSPQVDLDLPGGGVAPGPVQPGPQPVVDALVTSVLTLFKQDTTPNKAALVKRLSEQWKGGLGLINECRTLGDLVSGMAALPGVDDKDALKPIRSYLRGVVSEELGTSLSAPLDREKATALFTRIVRALEGCQ